MDCTALEVAKSRTWLSDFHFTTGATWEAHVTHKQTEAQDWCKYLLQGHSWWAAQLFLTPSVLWRQTLGSSCPDIPPRLQCIVLQISLPFGSGLWWGALCQVIHMSMTLHCQPQPPSMLRPLKPDFQKYPLPSGWLKEVKRQFSVFMTPTFG